MALVTKENRLQAQCHVIGLLNEVEFVLAQLGHDKEEIKNYCEPLYELCDEGE